MLDDFPSGNQVLKDRCKYTVNAKIITRDSMVCCWYEFHVQANMLDATLPLLTLTTNAVTSF